MLRQLRPILLAALVIAFSGIALAAWTEFKSDDFGFTMLAPEGVKPEAHDYGHGWGGVHFAAGEHTEVLAIAHKGADVGPDAVREFAVEAAEVAADHWTKGESGKDVDGFKWIESWTASDDKHFVVAVLGAGPKGNYVIFVTSTHAEYDAAKADFEKFFKSIKVF